MEVRSSNTEVSSQNEPKYKGFDFGTYFAAFGLPDLDKVIVEQPSFFEGFGLGSTNIGSMRLRPYLSLTILLLLLRR